MAKPFIFKMIGDVADWLKSANETTDSIEDIADSLEDLDGTDVKLEEKFDDAMQAGKKYIEKLEDAEKAQEDLADSAKDAGREIENALEEAGKDAADGLTENLESAKKATDDLADSASSMGSEIGDAAKEAIEGWDGSFADAIRSASDSIAGFIGAIGIGGALGNIAVSGISGLVNMFVDKWTEANEKVEARNKQMYEQMLQNANAYFNDEQIAENFNKILAGDEDALIDTDILNTYVEKTGKTAQEIALAFADTRSQQANDLRELLETNRAEFDRIKEANHEQLVSTEISWNEYHDRLENLKEAFPTWDIGEEFYEIQGIVDDTSQSIQSNTEFLRENGVGAADAAENNRRYAESILDTRQAISDATAAIQTNNDTISDATELAAANSEVLLDLAGNLIGHADAAREAGASGTELNDVLADNYVQFLEAANAAGITGQAAQDLAERYGIVPRDVSTDINLYGTEDAHRRIDTLEGAIQQIPRSVGIDVQFRVGDLASQVGAAIMRARNTASARSNFWIP